MSLSSSPVYHTHQLLMGVWSMCVRMDQLLSTAHSLGSATIVFKKIILKSLAMLDLAFVGSVRCRRPSESH